MSSTLTSTELLKLPSKQVEDLKYQKLVRSSSIDKIRVQLNSYICNQHYYFLPYLSAWLKSSQYALHNSAEKTVHTFRTLRSLLISAMIQKLLLTANHTAKPKSTVKTIDHSVSVAATLKEFYVEYREDLESLLLRSVVYTVCLILSCQLFFCLYVCAFTSIPAGLVFLVLSLCGISMVQFRTDLHFLSENSREDSETKHKTL